MALADASEDLLLLDHKLSGYLCAVLSVNSPQLRSIENLATHTLCSIFSDGCDIVGFRTENGLVLVPVDASSGNALVDGNSSDQQDKTLTWQCGVLPETLQQNSPADPGETVTRSNLKSTPTSSSKRKRRRIGLVNGSPSVIHHLYALVNHKCLSIVARVVSAAGSGSGATRVVVLVDVYLRLAVWDGWQFPHSRSLAGYVFSHLSCDWIERNAILSADGYEKSGIQSNNSLWNLADCHVLKCKIHSVLPDFSKKKLFDLHEIFKSLPAVGKRGRLDSTILQPVGETSASGIWGLSDDLIVNILTTLGPLDLIRVAATCRHLRSLAVDVMPCMKLKLFPHQQAAVEWMLKREKSSEVLPHPLYKNFFTVDGFAFAVNSISGEIFVGSAPTVKDFIGGMFCDEPGLGKTITALSLILKTQGKLADPPDGTNVVWCSHYGGQRCGYYEQSSDSAAGGILGRASHSIRLGESSCTDLLVLSPPKRAKLTIPDEELARCSYTVGKLMTPSSAIRTRSLTQCTRTLNCIKKNLLPAYGEASDSSAENDLVQDSHQRGYTAEIIRQDIEGNKCASYSGTLSDVKRCRSASSLTTITESWVQCDACHKWRKISRENLSSSSAAWFCSMNTDPAYQSCGIPEECMDGHLPITELPGFCLKGTSGGERQNVAFFSNMLMEHFPLSSQTKKALTWLAKLFPEELSQMETTGLRSPCVVSIVHAAGFCRIFKSFGLRKKVEKGVCMWYYPRHIENLVFDVSALRIALSEPLSSVIYLSCATLIVVPANLIEHWTTQIQKHTRLSQLRVYVLNSGRQISPHILAWDYDIVITTFNRFSVEWSPRKKSVLQQVHWLRIILDEGHTLGSSLCLTNKLNLAISLKASSRWVLTGTPTPNTPNSELSHLQIMLKFLHEEVYGQSQKSWEAGIVRPFEAEMEEGRTRLFDILSRCMISARKKDLKAIPPCIKKVTLINFTEEHAKSYNELVVTVRRNILMADWNDPSHVESLLNPKQWKFRSTTIRNVRLSCCVSGHIKVTETGQDIQETMDILCEKGLVAHQEEYALIQYNLVNGGTCARCEEWCRLPVITPCRHLLCLDCVALDSQRCAAPGCSYLYEMQTPESRPENPNPKWPVPKDLIELQPSYKQDDWNPDWQSTSSSKVSYLVKKLNELIGANKPPSSLESDVLLYSSDLTNLKKASAAAGDAYSIGLIAKPEKVIIYSQFLEHIHVIEQQEKLTFSGIRFVGMYSPMHSNNKMKSLATFQYDPTCTALLMDGSAALGLDLSFVSHVFLMEPIWDKSMEEQVISRAHRMGASRPIHVETLAMCGTIEQQMVELLQDSDSCRGFLSQDEFGNPPENEGGRRAAANRSLHDFAGSNYLSRLKCVQIKHH